MWVFPLLRETFPLLEKQRRLPHQVRTAQLEDKNSEHGYSWLP